MLCPFPKSDLFKITEGRKPQISHVTATLLTAVIPKGEELSKSETKLLIADYSSLYLYQIWRESDKHQ